MPKFRELIGLGILLVLATSMFLWTNREEAAWRSGSNSNAPTSGVRNDAPRGGGDGRSGGRVARELNVESRVRSLLQVAPGETTKIRIPASEFGRLLPEDWEKKWAGMALVPISRELVVQGLEEILRQGGSLGSKVDFENGKIDWKDDGVFVSGTMDELGEGQRRLSVVVVDEMSASKNSYESIVRIQGHSFFLVHVPGSDAEGVLLVFGDDPKAKEAGEPSK